MKSTALVFIVVLRVKIRIILFIIVKTQRSTSQQSVTQDSNNNQV